MSLQKFHQNLINGQKCGIFGQEELEKNNLDAASDMSDHIRYLFPK